MQKEEEGEEAGAKAQPGDPAHVGPQETPLQPQLEVEGWPRGSDSHRCPGGNSVVPTGSE